MNSLEDRIFGDDDTNTALAAPALTQAAASLIRRGFPARLFVDDTRGGAPLFGGHIGFGCKPVMSAAKDFGLAEGDLAALLKEGQIIAITANAARFRLAKTHSLAALAPTLDKMTDRLTALLGHASR